MFSSSGNGDIAYCDVQGELGMISVASEAGVVGQRDEVVQEDSLDVDLPRALQESDGDDDEDNENVISLEKLKRETLGAEESESEARSGK